MNNLCRIGLDKPLDLTASVEQVVLKDYQSNEYWHALINTPTILCAQLVAVRKGFWVEIICNVFVVIIDTSQVFRINGEMFAGFNLGKDTWYMTW